MSRGHKRQHGATGGVVYRRQLKPAPVTRAQRALLDALRGAVRPLEPSEVIRRAELPERAGWTALAALVDRGWVLAAAGGVRLTRSGR